MASVDGHAGGASCTPCTGTGRPPGDFAPILLSGQNRGDILTSIRSSSDHAHLSQLAQECLADGLSELSRGVLDYRPYAWP